MSIMLAVNISGFNCLVCKTWGATFAMISSNLNSLIPFLRNRMLRKEAKSVLNKELVKS